LAPGWTNLTWRNVSDLKPAPITEELANKLIDYAIACDWGQSGQ
jgi:hypothetical protein